MSKSTVCFISPHIPSSVGNLSNHQSNTSPPPDKIIRLKEIQELTELSRTTIWHLEREGEHFLHEFR